MSAAARNWRLGYVSSAAALGGFLFGFDSIVVSGAIPLIRLKLALGPGAEGSFVAASLVGCMVSAPLAGVLADRIGRRPNLFAAAALTLIAAVMSAAAQDLQGLVVARFASGLGVGVASMVCPLYIAELSPPKRRGLLVSLYQFAITIGICASLFCNAAVLAAAQTDWMRGLFGGDAWRAMFAAQVIPSIVFFALCLAVPESPRWLAGRGRSGAARRALGRLMAPDEVEATVAEIEAARAEERNGRARYRQLLEPHNLRPLELALILAAFSELSGITVVFYYGPTILADAGFAVGGAVGGFTIIGVVNMVATVIALSLIDRVGRRPLLLWGTAGALVSLVSTGTLLALHTHQPWLLVLSICGFVTAFACSLGPVKFVVASEIFPTAIRSRAVAVFIFLAFAGGALINFLFPTIRQAFGAEASFFLFAAILAPQLAYVAWRMPETAGRSLEEIQTLWRPRAVRAV